jgi:excisionase family DNA binding protein
MLITTKEAATMIGCTTRNITRLVNKGKLNPTHKGKMYFLFEKREVDNYLTIIGGKKND